MRLIKKLLWIAFLFVIACVLFFAGYYFAVTKNTSLQAEKLLLSDTNFCVYDINGQPIKNVGSFSPNQTIDLTDIPLHTKNAFVYTEDKHFYSHNGFDVKRIVKAAINNLKSRSFKEGASTISQQLIKNTHLSQEKTIKRKLREWKLTKQLESLYTKEQILEKYLNTIYFGHNCFGIGAAAEFYFGKTPSELSLADSAILAGLVKSPNYYSPFKNPEKCKERKLCVLNLLNRNEKISEKEKENAVLEALPTAPTLKNNYLGYLHFVYDELSELELQNRHNFNGKVEIYTFFDPTVQADIEKIASVNTECDKSILVLDNQNHGFKAALSSVGNIRRLPGSLIKPLLVYAPALEENLLSPATPIADEEVNYNGYRSKNYDGKFRGYVSTRECVEKSLNIPAVKTLSALGIKKAVDYLNRLGLSVEKDDYSLSLALGGMKNGFSMRNIMQAYSVFANQGEYSPCGFILKIQIDGKIVYHKQSEKKKIFSKESAYLMTDMLKSTTENGTAKKLRSLPFDIAAKTGTAGSINGNTDAYALSYTPRDCVGIWLGNKDNTAMSHTGGGLPCDLLRAVNESLYETYQKRKGEISSFNVPKKVVRVALDKNAYYDTHTLEIADDIAPIEYRIYELFKKDNIPLIKSVFFSNPRIFQPNLSLLDGKIVITFQDKTPTCYQYKIDRFDYVTHNTVYFGDYTKEFIDETVLQNKSYVYTVTPIYKGNVGQSVTLPAVKTNEKIEMPPNEKIPDNWWNH